ncbi:MAG: hypothetical protein QXO40_00095 [Candidatus Aenigmatarchaeota archaeon]
MLELYRYVEIIKQEEKKRIELNSIDISQSYDIKFKPFLYRNAFELKNEEYIGFLYFVFENDDLNKLLNDVNDFLMFLNEIEKNYNVVYDGDNKIYVLISPTRFLLSSSGVNFIKIIRLMGKVLGYFNDSFKDYYDENFYMYLPNTLNPKTRLYCCDITNFNISNKEELLNFAKKPSNTKLPFNIFNLKLNKDLHQYFEVIKLAFNELNKIILVNPKEEINIPEKFSPSCINSLLSSFDKNNVKHLINYILYIKDFLNYDKNTTSNFLFRELYPGFDELKSKHLDFNERFIIQLNEVLIEEIYEKDIKFACSYIRSISSEKSKIECNKKECEEAGLEVLIKNEPIEVLLEEATDSIFTNFLLKFEGIVTSKNTTPYLIPSNITIECSFANEENKKCKTCIVFQNGGVINKVFDTSTDIVAKFIEVSDKQKEKIIKEELELPNCKHLKVKVNEYKNVWDIQIIPCFMVTPQFLLPIKREYVVRRVLAVMPNIEGNTTYEFIARLVSSPKDASAIFVCEKVNKMTDELDLNHNFNQEYFKCFKCNEDKESIWEKLKDKYYRLSHNILKIYNRFDMFLAFDIIFHTPLGLIFNGELVKGWGDCIIIGDTGQGKTQMAERLLKFYNIGAIISGEASTRTGITWTMHQVGKSWHIVWGMLPKCDRKLLIIDEFHELKEDDIEKLSRARSSGIVEVYGTISAKTPARTRLIMLANPKLKTLSQIPYGITELLNIFRAPEDIRRLDFALFISSDEIDPRTYSQRPENIELVYAPDYCRELIKFVWTRKPEQIIFTNEAIDYILEKVLELGNEFSSSIPVLERSDLRFKLARISSAIASIVASIEDDKIIVKKPHCEVAYEFLKKIYTKPSASFDLYSMGFKPPVLDDKSKEYIKTLLLSIDEEKRNALIDYFLQVQYIRQKDLKDFLDISNEMIKTFLNYLYQKKLIVYKSKGYVKTGVLIEFLKKLRYEKWENIEI